MENKARKICLYAAAGVLVAFLIIAGLFISGVQLPSTTAPVFKVQTGTLVVLLKDAPVNLTHLNITIDSFSVLNVSETWVNIAPPFPKGKNEAYFDLLTLENVTMELVNEEIPAGNYTKMRMTIKTANATFADEHVSDLEVPPGHIDIIIHFIIKPDETTVLLIDMQADWIEISKTNRLRPVLKASVAQQP